MGEQPRSFFVSFIANQGKLNHLAVEKREDGTYHPAQGKVRFIVAAFFSFLFVLAIVFLCLCK